MLIESTVMVTRQEQFLVWKTCKNKEFTGIDAWIYTMFRRRQMGMWKWRDKPPPA